MMREGSRSLNSSGDGMMGGMEMGGQLGCKAVLVARQS